MVDGAGVRVVSVPDGAMVVGVAGVVAAGVGAVVGGLVGGAAVRGAVPGAAVVGGGVVGGGVVVVSDGSAAGVATESSAAEVRAPPTASATASTAADVVIATTRVIDGRSERRVRMGGMVRRIRLRSASMSGDERVSAPDSERFTDFSEFPRTLAVLARSERRLRTPRLRIPCALRWPVIPPEQTASPRPRRRQAPRRTSSWRSTSGPPGSRPVW